MTYEKGLLIAQTEKVRATKEARLAMPALQWIPHAADTLLKKLGLDPNKVAKLGFADVKKQIIEISKSKEAGLTRTEREIVRRKLEGRRREDIAHSMKTSPWTISITESSAAQKIRGKMKMKRASSQ